MTGLAVIILALALLGVIAKLIDVAVFGSIDDDWDWDTHDPRPVIRDRPRDVPYDWRTDCPDV